MEVRGLFSSCEALAAKSRAHVLRLAHAREVAVKPANQVADALHGGAQFGIENFAVLHFLQMGFTGKQALDLL